MQQYTWQCKTEGKGDLDPLWASRETCHLRVYLNQFHLVNSNRRIPFLQNRNRRTPKTQYIESWHVPMSPEVLPCFKFLGFPMFSEEKRDGTELLLLLDNNHITIDHMLAITSWLIFLLPASYFVNRKAETPRRPAALMSLMLKKFSNEEECCSLRISCTTHHAQQFSSCTFVLAISIRTLKK